MIDFHSHILPGVDDGAPDLEASLALLRQEKEAGVTRVYLTPHQNSKIQRIDELKAVYEKLKEAAKDLGIELLLGAEIYYYPGMVDDLKAGKLLTMNDSKFVLVEFCVKTEINIPEIMYEIKVAGYEPILAHIERYTYLRREDYFEIKDCGCYIQVNSTCFDHALLDCKLKFLFKNGLVDFVGTDAHHAEKRPVCWEKFKKLVSKKFKKQMNKLFETDIITK